MNLHYSFLKLASLVLLLAGSNWLNAQCSLALTASVSPLPAFACNSTNGILTIDMTGAAPYTILLQFNGTPQPVMTSSQNQLVLTGLVTATYQVTVTDNTGCTTSSGTVVTATPPLDMNLAPVVTSCNQNNGSVACSVTGGQPPYTYLWSNGATTQTITGLGAGTYAVTIMDSYGCSFAGEALVQTSGGPNIGFAITNVNCFGLANGNINMSLNSGFPPFTYTWSNGATTEDLNNLVAGIYTVTVTGANACTTTKTATISQPTAINLSFSTTSPCTNNANGSINLSLFGGTPPYAYFWSTGATTQDLSTLTAGTYTVTVVDNVACTKTGSRVLTAIPSTVSLALSASVSTQLPEVCTGINGVLTMSATGNPPFDFIYQRVGLPPGSVFLITSPQNTVSIPNLLSGNYSVTVTDNSGICSATQTISISTTPVLGVTLTPTNSACTQNNGTVTSSASGGFAPFTYTWTNGATTSSINNLSAGYYGLTVTDIIGCTAASGVVISNAIPVSISGANNICPETAVTLTASGTGTYAWSNGATTPSIEVVLSAPGTYTVTVFNSASCTNTASVTVNVLPTTNAAITGNANICNGESTALTASGGGNFLWSTGETTATITVAPANIASYTVTVSDPNTCSSSAFKTVQRVVSLSAQVINNDCSEGSSGTIIINVNGGGPATDYTWNSGQNTPTVTNVPAGAYTVTVTGSGGCTSSATAVVGDALNINDISTNSSCTTATGSINLSVSGGFPPYQYAWSNGAITEDLANLSTGVYTVTVTDASGCTRSKLIFLNATFQILAALAPTNINCVNGTLGAVNLNILQNGSYSYEWDGPNGFHSTEKNISGLQFGGVYSVVITNSNGCTDTLNTTLVSPNGFNVTSESINATCGQGDGAVNLTIEGGTGPFNYAWSNGANSPNITNLLAGTYSVSITDSGSGCTVALPNIVQNNSDITISGSITNTSCFNSENGAIHLSVTGSAPPFSFIWSDGTTASNLLNLGAGTFTVTVSDANNCQKIEKFEVSRPDSLVLSFTTSAPPSSPITNIIIKVFGGTAPYNYDWANVPGTNNPVVISQDCNANYSATVTDAHGCSVNNNFTLPNFTPLSIVEITQSVQCNGTLLTVVTNGGFSAKYYQWSGGGFEATKLAIVAGIYTVTVTDEMDCIQTATVTVMNNAGFTVNAFITPESCQGIQNGKINLTVTGSTEPFTFVWSNGATTEDLSGLSSVTYQVTITNNTGCSQVFSYTVTQLTPIQASFSAINPNCNGGTDGLLAVFVQGGTSPVNYNWEHIPGSNDPQTINNLAAGTYTVTITDNNGCSASNSITLSQPQPIAAYVVLDQLCGSTTMNITSVTGGTPPFTYFWSNGVTGTVNVANFSGLYTVTVTDANGCSGNQTIYAEVVTQGGCSYFGGKVVIDANANCIYDAETGLASWIVRATGNQTYYGISDADGNYHIGVDPGETYLIEAIPPGSLWMPCTGLTVTAPLTPDTTSGLDLPVQEILQCPEMEVHLYGGNIRRCFNNNYYGVEYCNNGTAPAQDAYIVVSMDAFSVPLSSTLPFTNLGNNNYRFDIGDVAVGDCNSFNIVFRVNCNAFTGQTSCATAHIYPDSTCMPPNALWSGASLALSSACTGDSLRFTVKNVGFGNMTQTLDYIVVEDHVMLFSNPVKLNAGQSKMVSVPSNGSTWRLAVPQEPYHPGHSNPSLTVEGCSTNSSSFSTGFVNQFPQDDVDPWIDILCVQLTAAFDPNEKVAFPTGYGNEHFVEPGTQLEYGIHFQNTGNDTAFTVRLVDTLSQWLDPATIRPGASSHPYTFDLTGTGIATFTFDNVLLPDSNVNEVASHGFVQFTISPKITTPLETVIHNSAAIYFDYNPPIFTNTTYHTIGDHFLVVGLWQPENPAYEVVVSPNPSSGLTNITIKGLVHSDALQLQVLDAYGRVVVNQQSSGNSFQLDGATLPAGIYYFRVMQEGALVGNGKIIRK